jgi:hypothetical protein
LPEGTKQCPNKRPIQPKDLQDAKLNSLHWPNWKQKPKAYPVSHPEEQHHKDQLQFSEAEGQGNQQSSQFQLKHQQIQFLESAPQEKANRPHSNLLEFYTEFPLGFPMPWLGSGSIRSSPLYPSLIARSLELLLRPEVTKGVEHPLLFTKTDLQGFQIKKNQTDQRQLWAKVKVAQQLKGLA